MICYKIIEPTRREPPIWSSYEDFGCVQTRGSANIERAKLVCLGIEDCYAVEEIGNRGFYCRAGTTWLETKLLGSINLEFRRDGIGWIKGMDLWDRESKIVGS